MSVLETFLSMGRKQPDVVVIDRAAGGTGLQRINQRAVGGNATLAFADAFLPVRA